QDPQWEGRGHFFAVATKMIRRILVDNARRKSAKKRGGKIKPSMLEEALTVPVPAGVDLLVLEEALQELEKVDSRKCQVVEMRFFGGLEAKEISLILGTTEATVRRDWKIAKAWLYRRLQRGSSS